MPIANTASIYYTVIAAKSAIYSWLAKIKMVAGCVAFNN
jgi:hypothetical protein